jgi:hypothetical protein
MQDAILGNIEARTRTDTDLIHVGDKYYQIRKRTANTHYLVCHGCHTGTAVLRVATGIVYAGQVACSPNCAPKVDQYIQQHYHDQLKTEFATRNAGMKRKAIYEEVRHQMELECGEDAALNFPNAQRKKSAMYRARAETIPPVPRYYEDIPLGAEVPARFAFTNYGRDQFLYLNQPLVADGEAGDARIMVFTTAADIAALRNAERVFMDGTFKVTPAPFKQLFSMHTLQGFGTNYQMLVPRLYVLLPGKSEATYTAALELILQLLEQGGDHAGQPVGGGGVQWRRLGVDFESGLLAALCHGGFVAEGAELALEGCLFHYCNAVYKHLSSGETNLAHEYQTVPAFKRFAKMVFALPMLREDDMVPAFYALLGFYVPADLRADQRLRGFARYMFTQWLDNPLMRRTCNCYDRYDRRTNNDLEGYHNGLGQRLRQHGNLWNFIESLSGLHTESRANEEQVLAQGQGIRRRGRNIVEREEHIEHCRTRYANHEIDALRYLWYMARHMPGF